MVSMKSATGWVLAPATEDVPRSQAIGASALRVLVGLLWVYNVAWKRPPDFGQEAGNGLYKFTSYAVSDPVLPPYSWVVENVVLKAFEPFGWGVLLAETTLAVLLLTGAWVRAAALLGLAQSVAIALSVAYAPHEWPWSYWLMIGAHGLLLVSSAGRFVAVDAVRAGLTSARGLGQIWGVGAIVVGLVSVVQSFDDPLASRGPGLRSTDVSLSLGQYNLVGGLVMMAAGALLVVAVRGGPRVAAQVAAVVAAVGAVSLHVQLGFSDPILGGTATSAAYLFSLALVAAVAGVKDRRSVDTTDHAAPAAPTGGTR